VALLDLTPDQLISTTRAVRRRLDLTTTQQVCLSPQAYTLGTDYHPAGRSAADSVIHWDRW
jgi:hypothetical protein